jgi:hypothetical protein
VEKFLKPCVGLSVGKQVRSVWSYSEIVNRVIVARKFGRFGVSLMVARSSLRLAYNVRGFAKFVFVGVEKIPDFILLKF